MKTQIRFKLLLVLPAVVFVDWLLMVVIGCTTSLFGYGDGFYCGTYCCIGKGILITSTTIFLIYLFYPEIMKIVTHKKHAPTR